MDSVTTFASQIVENRLAEWRFWLKVAYVGGFLLVVLGSVIYFFIFGFPPLPECGIFPTKYTQLVINGTEAGIEEFPFYVSIKYRRSRKSHCGGSIIAPSWVLTAKHCVQTEDISLMCKSLETKLSGYCLQVIAGSGDSIDRSGGTVHNVALVKPFTPGTDIITSEDIALLFVEPPIKYKSHTKNNRGIMSVCLPNKDEKITERQSDLVGLGVISEFHSITATKLMTAKLNNLNIDDCFKLYRGKINKYEALVKQKFLCAGISKESKGACFGDSGGPLTVIRKNKPVQIGLVNSVADTGCGEKSTLFLNVMFYKEWIRSTIRIFNGDEI